MKKVGFLILFSSFLIAAESNLTDVIEPAGKLDPWRFQTGGQAVASIDSDSIHIGTGIYVGVSHRVADDSPFFLGIETGLLSTTGVGFEESNDVNFFVESVTVVPVLPTAMIRDESRKFHLYAGISVGPTFNKITERASSNGVRRVENDLGLMALFRGGGDIELANSVDLNLELLRFGLFQGAFTYAPVLSLSANL